VSVLNTRNKVDYLTPYRCIDTHSADYFAASIVFPNDEPSFGLISYEKFEEKSKKKAEGTPFAAFEDDYSHLTFTASIFCFLK